MKNKPKISIKAKGLEEALEKTLEVLEDEQVTSVFQVVRKEVVKRGLDLDNQHLMDNASKILLELTEPNDKSHVNSHIVDHALIVYEKYKKLKTKMRIYGFSWTEKDVLLWVERMSYEWKTMKKIIKETSGLIKFLARLLKR